MFPAVFFWRFFFRVFVLAFFGITFRRFLFSRFPPFPVFSKKKTLRFQTDSHISKERGKGGFWRLYMMLAVGLLLGLGDYISDSGWGLLGRWGNYGGDRKCPAVIYADPLVAGVVGLQRPISARGGG